MFVVPTLALLLAASLAAVQNPGTQVAKNLKTIYKVPVQMGYLLALPKEYGKDPNKKWPILLFLHGAGEVGTDLNKVKVHGPPKLVEAGQDLPFIVVSPQSPSWEQWWNVDGLMALLDEVEKKYKVDVEREYVTGLSMGGYGTWALAIAHPERFAAIAPICGGGTPRFADHCKSMGVWAFHGGKDPVVNVIESQVMVDALKAAGGEVKFTIYPEAGHDSWTETYENPELYTWLLSHKRAKKS